MKFSNTAAAPARASYINANLNQNPSFNACGSVDPIDPGEPCEPCAGSPNVSSVAVPGPVPGAGDGKAETHHGTNRVSASSSGGSIDAPDPH